MLTDAVPDLPVVTGQSIACESVRHSTHWADVFKNRTCRLTRTGLKWSQLFSSLRTLRTLHANPRSQCTPDHLGGIDVLHGQPPFT